MTEGDTLIQRSIVVPMRDNDGRPLTQERRAIEGELRRLAGGFTRYRTSGQWQDGARVYRDESVTYVVLAPSDTDTQIVNRLGAWCATLRQEALCTVATVAQVAFVAPQRAAARVAALVA